MKYGSSAGFPYMMAGIAALLGYAIGCVDRSGGFPLFHLVVARLPFATTAYFIIIVYSILAIRQIRNRAHQEMEQCNQALHLVKKETERRNTEASVSLSTAADVLRNTVGQVNPAALIHTLKQLTDGVNALLKLERDRSQKQQQNKAPAQQNNVSRKDASANSKNDERTATEDNTHNSQKDSSNSNKQNMTNTTQQQKSEAAKDSVKAPEPRTTSKPVSPSPGHMREARVTKDPIKESTTVRNDENNQINAMGPSGSAYEDPGFASRLKPQKAIPKGEGGQIWD